MSVSPFDQNLQVQKLLHQLLYSTPDVVLLALDAAAGLEPEVRAYLADQLEENVTFVLISGVDETAIQVLEARADALEEQRRNNTPLSAASPNLLPYVCLSSTVAFIVANKVEAANPVIQIYAATLAQLPAAEHSLPERHMRVLCCALKTIKAAFEDEHNGGPDIADNAPPPRAPKPPAP